MAVDAAAAAAGVRANTRHFDELPLATPRRSEIDPRRGLAAFRPTVSRPHLAASASGGNRSIN